MRRPPVAVAGGKDVREMLRQGGTEMTFLGAFSDVGIQVTDLAQMEDFYTRVPGRMGGQS